MLTKTKLADLSDKDLLDRFRAYEETYYKAKEAGNKAEAQAQVWKLVATKKEMAKRGIEIR